MLQSWVNLTIGGEEGREGAGDRSRAERSRQGNSGSFSAAADRTKTLLPVRPLTSCPLPARPLGHGRPLPACGHRNATHNLRSGRAWNRHHSTKVHLGPTGSTRSPMTSHCSNMPTLMGTGNKAAPTTFHDHGNPSHALRAPRDCETRCTGRPNMPTRPGQCTQGRARHTPAPGAPPWARPPSGTSPRWAAAGAQTSGIIRERPGTAAAPGPSQQPGTTPTAPAVDQRWACPPPQVILPARVRSTSDSSEAKTRTSDWHSCTRSKASATGAKPRKTRIRSVRLATPRTGGPRRLPRSPRIQTRRTPPTRRDPPDLRRRLVRALSEHLGLPHGRECLLHLPCQTPHLLRADALHVREGDKILA